MKFNDLPVSHKASWCRSADIIYYNMTPGKLLKLLEEHNPAVIRYGENGKCSAWENDEAREKFMADAGLRLKY